MTPRDQTMGLLRQSILRNTRLEVSLFHNGLQVLFIKPSEAAHLLASGGYKVRARSHGRVIAIENIPPAPPPSDSTPSPTTITLADMLAALGIPMRHDAWISRERMQSARDKIDAFAVPSWVDRLRVNTIGDSV